MNRAHEGLRDALRDLQRLIEDAREARLRREREKSGSPPPPPGGEVSVQTRLLEDAFQSDGERAAADLDDVDIFWGEIAQCEHLVQIYEDDQVYLDSLEGFIAGGLRAGDGVIVIATEAHRDALEKRLRERQIDILAARDRDQYIPLDAEETMARFMVNGWPDDDAFEAVVSNLLQRARKHGRVRAFGEMVALMWERGFHGAVVRLEHLWQRLCEKERFSLFCAYPKSGFTDDARISVKAICDAHSRLVPGTRRDRRFISVTHGPQ